MINSQLPFNRLKILSERTPSNSPLVQNAAATCLNALHYLKGYRDAMPKMEGILRLLRLTEARISFEMDGLPVSLLRLMEADASENHLDDELCAAIIRSAHQFSNKKAINLVDLNPDGPGKKSNQLYREKKEITVKSYFTNLTLYTAPSGSQLLRKLRRDLDEVLYAEPEDLQSISSIHYQLRAVSPFPQLNGHSARNSTTLLLQNLGFSDGFILFCDALADEKENYQNLMRNMMQAEALTDWHLFIFDRMEKATSKLVGLLKKVKEQSKRSEELINKYTDFNMPNGINAILYEHVYIKPIDIISALGCHRQTAYGYLSHLIKMGLLTEKRSGREKLYFHKDLFDLLSN
ncbi:MAG TPA: hypothetical protein VGF79_16070 [Bacteroidia bacterium]